MQSRRADQNKKADGTNNLKLPNTINGRESGGVLSPKGSGNASPNRYSVNKASAAHRRGNGSVGARMTTSKVGTPKQTSAKIADAFGEGSP